MRIKLKSDNKGGFGFVEVFKPYYYNEGAIKMKVIVDVGNYIPEPYIFRGGVFVPASQIELEMGISKYIKAKKPFYSVLGTGNLIIDMRVCYDLHTREYIKDKSSFKMFGVVKDSLSLDTKEGWSVELRQLNSSNTELEKWLDNLASEVAKYGDDREAFIKSRF